jgi:ankyrin repeat protein
MTTSRTNPFMTRIGFYWRRITSVIFFRTFAGLGPPHREALKDTGIRIVSVGLADEKARLIQNEVWESLKLLRKYDFLRFKRIIKEIVLILVYIERRPRHHSLGGRVCAVNLSQIPADYSSKMRQIAIAGRLVSEATFSLFYRRGMPPVKQFIDREKRISKLEMNRTFRKLRNVLLTDTGLQVPKIIYQPAVPFHDVFRDWDVKKIKAMLKDNPGLASSKDNYGETPLNWAARVGQKDVVEVLLANNVDVNAADNKIGYTSLHWAATKNRKAIVELLLANNAEVNARTHEGSTPLHFVAFDGYKDIAILLLDNNAVVNIKNNEGATPLHLAAKSGHNEVAELMLAYKADVNARTNDGTTPLRVALLQGHKEMADLLREHGGHEY